MAKSLSRERNNMKPLKIKGNIWLLTDKNSKPIHNIDTDMIFHNSHLHITDINEMGIHTFGNFSGWEGFNKKCSIGDIILVGKNFGCGSSRQQAVDCFISNGVSVIVAESFGAIYKRNAINSGLAIIEAPGIFSINEKIKSGDLIEIDFISGIIKIKSIEFNAKPMTDIQKDIYLAGNLFEYGKKI
jgi:3-isopropylmalate/(R)-2-methylmalate dehydratase small subunit